MNSFFAPYRSFFSQPDIARTLFLTWFARLPVGMSALAILLYMRESLGDFQRAGGIVGAYFVSMAILAPLQGRIIDRRGPKVVLIVCGLMQPTFLLLLFAATEAALPYTLLMALAIVAGMFSPPITVVTRTHWRHRFHADKERRMAFSVDAVFMELCFTVGPSLVALVVAAANAKAAYLMTAVYAYGAVWLFLSSPVLRYWIREPPTERHFLGPLTDPKLVMLFVLTLGLTFCFGLMEVGYPAYARGIGLPAFGGVLLTINSLGSALAGAIYAGLHLKLRVERQFAWMMVIMSVTLAMHALAGGQWPFSVVAFLAGAAIAPAIAAQSILVARMSDVKYATEAFTWSSTFIVVGLGTGMAAGGAIVEKMNTIAPFLTGSGVALAMAVGAWGLRPWKV